MSGWDDTPAPDGWAPDTSNGAVDDVNNADSEFLDNISKHAGGSGDNGCRICGNEGHFARDCPKPRPEGMNSGLCYNCNEPGHNKADCPNETVERAFTGECRTCGQAGHRAADCTNKGPDFCRACKQEGHVAADCSNNRLFASLGITAEDLVPETAWAALIQADREKDVDDIKKSLLEYAKSVPGTKLPDLEAAFREENFNTHLIAIEQEISITHTIVNLQGEADQKYVMTIQWSDKPRRKRFADGWPTDSEDNKARLAEAGFVLDGLVVKCDNCNGLGHIKAKCGQEKVDVTANTALVCAICNENDHRARDCKQPRKKPGAKGCRNCGNEEHIAKDCPEPPNPDNVECRNCGVTGHFSRDCPSRKPELCRSCNEEGHRAKDCTKERVMICRNCDTEGHISRECPAPRDYSRVECSNCHQKGHTQVRCKQSKPEADAPAEDSFGGDSGAAAGGDFGGGDFGGEDSFSGAPATAEGSWNTESAW